jgi:DNA-binding beta-propeller fold protein YncE
LSDQILRYDGTTGAFIDVFAERQGEVADGLNDPNGLLFDPDGHLYVTTQGSVVVNGRADFSFGLPSIILRYGITIPMGAVFAEHPHLHPIVLALSAFWG